MDFPEALDAALSRRYPWGEPKSPATSKRGRDARMRHLEARFGGVAGAAQAAGIGPSTWRHWKAGTRPPSPANLRKLEGAYARQIVRPKLMAAVLRKGYPTQASITAIVVADPGTPAAPGARYINGGSATHPGAHREFKAGKLRGDLMIRMVNAWTTAGPEAAAAALQDAIKVAYKTEFAFEGNDVTVRIT